MRSFSRWVRNELPLSRQVRMVARLLPRRWWYPFCLQVARTHGRLRTMRGGNGRVTEALMLDHWMREFTQVAGFPIPYTSHGGEVVQRARAQGPVVYCWTHLPLAEFPLRALVEGGLDEPVVVSDPGRTTPDGGLVVYGLAEHLPVILGDGYSLVRMRSTLLSGRSVACLADAWLGGPLSRHPMRVARMAGARLMFQWAERRPDGTIDVTFLDAPRPECENDAAIDENLEFLRVANERVLRMLGFEPGAVAGVHAHAGRAAKSTNDIV